MKSLGDKGNNSGAGDTRETGNEDPGHRKKRLKARIDHVTTEISRREEQQEEQRRDESTQS